ncbi:MAG: hypothetical protein FD187_3131 [bacterium]|nr:MAG: hypothetical protein FD187_3131 [bacterium]
MGHMIDKVRILSRAYHSATNFTYPLWGILRGHLGDGQVLLLPDFDFTYPFPLFLF